VIQRVRALSKKTDTQKVPLDINDVVNDVIALVRRELLSPASSGRRGAGATDTGVAPPNWRERER
jgi:hypothetical protein